MPQGASKARKTLSLRVEGELIAELDKISDGSEFTRSSLINLAIKYSLPNLRKAVQAFESAMLDEGESHEGESHD